MTDDSDGRNVPPCRVDAGNKGMKDTVSVLTSNNNKILMKSVYGYKPEMVHQFSQKTIDRLQFGSRSQAAYSFWSVIGSQFDRVVDLSAGAGAEMAVAAKFVPDTVAYDSDPNSCEMSKDSPLLHNVSYDYPSGKADAVLLDPYWGDRYVKESKLLVLQDINWVLGVLNRAKPFEPGLVIMKAPKNVKINWLQRVLHVQFDDSNTSYLVISDDVSERLIPVIDAFKNREGVKLTVCYDETLDILKQRGCVFDNYVNPVSDCYVEQMSPSPGCGEVLNNNNNNNAFGDDGTEVYDPEVEDFLPDYKNNPMCVVEKDEVKREFVEELVKTAFPTGIPDLLKPLLESIKSIKFEDLLENILTAIKSLLGKIGGQTGGSGNDNVQTVLDNLGLPESLKSLVMQILEFSTERVRVLIKEILIMISGEELSDVFPKGSRTDCFTRSKRVVRLSGQTSEASGFWYHGVFITAYHATQGEPVLLNGVKVKASGVDKFKDLAWYGGELKPFCRARKGQRLFISTPGFQQEGVVISTTPLQIKFPGAPIPSLSGSPIYDYSGKVYGIYSNHLPGYGSYTAIETNGLWVDMVKEAVSQKNSVNVYVPCGSGKTTFLMQKLSLSYRTLCILPRSALPAEVSKMVGTSKGVTCKGFAGEDEIDDAGCNLVYITHGKFVNALMKNPNRFDEYDLIVVDEAHDNTALTKTCVRWVDTFWTTRSGKRAILMTGSPNGEEFTNVAESMSRHKVVKNVLPNTEGLSVDEMVKHVIHEYESGQTHLVQVPSVTYANKVISKLKDQGPGIECLTLSRESINTKGFDYFDSKAKEGDVVIFATNVLNIGFTVSLDKLTLQGTVREAESADGRMTSIDPRNLTVPERSQWVGRAGRVKEGVVFIPNLKWSRVQLTAVEGRLLEAYCVALGMSKDNKVGGIVCSVEKAKTLTKLPMAVNQGLGIVDEFGIAYVRNEKTLELLRDAKVKAAIGSYETRHYTDGRGKTYRGTSTGYDPTASEFNELEDLMAVKTGFGTSLILMMIAYGIVRMVKKEVMELVDGWSCSEAFQKGPSNDKPPVPLQPGIMMSDFSQTVSDESPFFNTITTSFLGDLKDKIVDMIPPIFPSFYKGVTVYTKFRDRKIGLMTAYYIGGLQLTGKFTVGVDIPDFSSEDRETQVASSSYLQEISDKLLGPSLVKTSHVLAFLSSLVLGVPAMLFLVAFSWLLHGKVGPNLIFIQKWLSKVVSLHDATLVKRSLFGSVLLKTNFALASTLFPMLGVLYVFLSMPWKITKKVEWFGFATNCTVHFEFGEWLNKFRTYIPFLTLGSTTNFALKTSFVYFSNLAVNVARNCLTMSGDWFSSNPVWHFINNTNVRGLLQQFVTSRCILERPLGFVGVLTKLGLYSPALVLGYTIDSVMTFGVITVMSFIMFYGPQFPMWTLIYPLTCGIVFVAGFFNGPFYYELAFLLLLVFYLRLNVSELKTMVVKGKFADFTSRDSLVRVINDKLFMAHERLSDALPWRKCGDGLFNIEGRDFVEVNAVQAAILTSYEQCFAGVGNGLRTVIQWLGMCQMQLRSQLFSLLEMMRGGCNYELFTINRDIFLNGLRSKVKRVVNVGVTFLLKRTMSGRLRDDVLWISRVIVLMVIFVRGQNVVKRILKLLLFLLSVCACYSQKTMSVIDVMQVCLTFPKPVSFVGLITCMSIKRDANYKMGDLSFLLCGLLTIALRGDILSLLINEVFCYFEAEVGTRVILSSLYYIVKDNPALLLLSLYQASILRTLWTLNGNDDEVLDDDDSVCSMPSLDSQSSGRNEDVNSVDDNIVGEQPLVEEVVASEELIEVKDSVVRDKSTYSDVLECCQGNWHMVKSKGKTFPNSLSFVCDKVGFTCQEETLDESEERDNDDEYTSEDIARLSALVKTSFTLEEFRCCASAVKTTITSLWSHLRRIAGSVLDAKSGDDLLARIQSALKDVVSAGAKTSKIQWGHKVHKTVKAWSRPTKMTAYDDARDFEIAEDEFVGTSFKSVFADGVNWMRDFRGSNYLSPLVATLSSSIVAMSADTFPLRLIYLIMSMQVVVFVGVCSLVWCLLSDDDSFEPSDLILTTFSSTFEKWLNSSFKMVSGFFLLFIKSWESLLFVNTVPYITLYSIIALQIATLFVLCYYAHDKGIFRDVYERFKPPADLEDCNNSSEQGSKSDESSSGSDASLSSAKPVPGYTNRFSFFNPVKTSWRGCYPVSRKEAKLRSQDVLRRTTIKVMLQAAKKTKWVITFGLSLVVLAISSKMHKLALAFSSLNMIFLIWSLMIYGMRYSSVQDDEFSKNLTKFLHHTVFNDTDMQTTTYSMKFDQLPVPKTRTCLVVGVAGSKVWLEKALGLYASTCVKVPDLSMLLVCDETLYQLACKLNLPDCVSLYKVQITDPREMRSARMIPMFMGHKDVYYLHRDADWVMTPLELQALKLRTNMTCNPLGASPTPVLMASVNYFGSSFSEYFEYWLNTKPYWKTYGHDELIARNFKVDHIYNRSTTLEENIHYMSSVACDVPPSRMIVPKPFLHNSTNDTDVTLWRVGEMKSYGDMKWRKMLHNLSASPKAFCGAGYTTTIKTSWHLASHLFLVCALVTAAVGYWLEPIFFNIGKQEYYSDKVSTSFSAWYNLICSSKKFYEDSLFTIGLFIGLTTTVPLAAKQIRRCKALLVEDSMYADDYVGWRASRAVRGVQTFLQLDQNKVECMKFFNWFAFLSSPIGFIFSKLALSFMPFLKSIDVALAFSFLFSGKRLSFLPVLCFLLSSVGVPGMFESGMFLGNIACIRTAHSVKFWSHYPYPGVKGVLELPYMGMSDSEVVKQMTLRDEVEPFVCAFRRKRGLRMELPQGMINSRTATAMFLARRSFVNYRDYKSVCVFGSGIGGFAQGMLHEGFKGQMVLLTLPEKGFETSDLVKSDTSEITTTIGDGMDHSGTYDIVVCDVAKSASEEIWWLDDFSYEWDRCVYEEKCLFKSVSMVKKGGDFICSVGILNDRMFMTVLDFLSIHFKEITVVDEPLKNDLGHHFLVAKGKLNRRHPDLVGLLPNNFSFTTSENYTKYADFSTALASTVKTLEGDCNWNGYFTPELFRSFRFGIQQTTTIDSVDNNLLEVPLSQDSYDFLTNTPVEYQNSFLEVVQGKTMLVSNPHDSTTAYKVVARVDPPPVTDREFNAGVDVLSQMALSKAGVLPLDKMFDVPSQSNYACRNGLKKRYDFPEVLPDVSKLDAVVSAMINRYKNVFATHDFSPPPMDEFIDHVNRHSSCGYMYSGKAKTVIDLVKNHWHEVEACIHTIKYGGRINLTFHSNPKPEKKEIATLVEEAVPRLFLYRQGDVRTAKVYISYVLNQVMADRTLWHSAACGDVFKKANIICSAYESYKQPAGCVFEASKWDGHVCGELYTKERMMLVELLKGNDSAITLSTMLHSMARYDIYGSVYMCSGDIVVFTRANKKSGEDDTSYGNKIKNDMIACHLISESLGIHPIDTFDRVSQVTEGDDKEIIGELDDIVKIASLRNEVYDSYGMPQKGDSVVIRHPEHSTFCSHGSTRLSNGIAVPIRDLHEVLGRHIVPLANGQFNIDFSMAARSLSSMISMVAMFWYLPHIRNLYSVIRDVIPKDVIPAAITREERWKFYHMIGVENPTKFDLEAYLTERFGYVPYDGRINDLAREVLRVDDFKGLLSLRAPYIIEDVRSLLHSSGEIFDITIWFEELITNDQIIKDTEYWDKKGFSVQLMTQKPHQIRESYLNGLTPHTGVQFGSFTSILGRVKAPVLHLIFSTEIGSTLSWAINLLTASRARNSGFKGERIVFGTLNVEGDYEYVKSIKTTFNNLPLKMTTLLIFIAKMKHIKQFILISTTICLVSAGLFGLPDVIKTNRYTVRGLTIRSERATVVSHTATIREKIMGIKHEPISPLVLGPPRTLAYLNVGGKELRYSLRKRTAVDTLQLLTKTSRRFGVIVFDDYGCIHPYLYYNQTSDMRVTRSEIAKMKSKMADLLGVPESQILPTDQWKCNGAMLTVTDWKGEYEYGQFERPMSKLENLEGRLTSVVMFIRISDCPMLRLDGTEANRYVFSESMRVPKVPYFGLVLGESTSEDHVDIPKPYDADLLQQPNTTEYVRFSDKTMSAVFRGGSTGAGADANSNVRHMLVNNEDGLSKLSGVKCDFKFVSVRKRLCVTLEGNLNAVSDHVVHPKMSYGEMGTHAIIVCPEGNEAPDRVLNCMATGSAVLMIEPKFCIGVAGWMDKILIDGYNVYRCEASLEGVASKLKEIAANVSDLEKVANRGRVLALKFLSDDLQYEYVESIVNLINVANTGFTTKVSDAVSWFPKQRGQHHIDFIDKEHSYKHGSALNMDSSLFTFGRIKDRSMGSGVSLYEVDVVAALEFHQTATVIDSHHSNSNILLRGEEMSKLERIVGSRLQAKEIALSLGRFGPGNDFAELVGNQGKLYLLLHTGAGNYSSVVMKDEVDQNRVELDRGKEICLAATLVGQLNRDIFARMFGAGKKVYDFPHNFYLDESVAAKFGMPRSNWLISKMTLPINGFVLMLGGPGHGAALLKADNCPNPHGTGGKGGRFRMLKGVSVANTYTALERYARRMMVTHPTGIYSRSNVERADSIAVQTPH